MIIIISLLIISFLGMVAMIYFKMVEIRTGRQYLFFNEKSDHLVLNSQNNLRRFFQRWNFRILNNYYDLLLNKIESFFLSIYRIIRRRFDRPINMVKGVGEDNQSKPE